MTEDFYQLQADINAIYSVLYACAPHLKQSLLTLIGCAANHSTDADYVRYYTGLSEQDSAEVAEVSAKVNAWITAGINAGHLQVNHVPSPTRVTKPPRYPEVNA